MGGLARVANFGVYYGGVILKDQNVQKIFSAGVGIFLSHLYSTYSNEVPALKSSLADAKHTIELLKDRFAELRFINPSDYDDAAIKIGRLCSGIESSQRQASSTALMFDVVNIKSEEIIRKSDDRIKKSMNVQGGGLIMHPLSVHNLTQATVEVVGLVQRVHNCHEAKVQCESTIDKCRDTISTLEDRTAHYHREILEAQSKHEVCLRNMATKNEEKGEAEKRHGELIAKLEKDKAQLEKDKTIMSEQYGQKIAQLEKDKTQLEKDKTAMSERYGQKIAQLEKDKAQLEKEKKDISDQGAERLLNCEKEKNTLTAAKAAAQTNAEQFKTQKEEADDQFKKCNEKGFVRRTFCWFN